MVHVFIVRLQFPLQGPPLYEVVQNQQQPQSTGPQVNTGSTAQQTTGPQQPTQMQNSAGPRQAFLLPRPGISTTNLLCWKPLLTAGIYTGYLQNCIPKPSCATVHDSTVACCKLSPPPPPPPPPPPRCSAS